MSRGSQTRAGARPRLLLLVLAMLLGVGGLLGLPVQAAADGPTTFSNTTSIAIPATGSIDQTGPASPYPSALDVDGMAGLVTTVTATFRGLSHSSAGDIDAMLVAPTGANLVLLSDIGDPVDPGDPDQLVIASNDTITFADSAAERVPAQVDLPSSTFLPSNTNSGDTFPGSAITPSTNTRFGDAFTGIDPNGSWRLFIVDDTDGDVGEMAGGWSLTITTAEMGVATTTVVTSSDSTSFTTDEVTFTATVTAPDGSPVTGGTVQFRDGATNLGSEVSVNEFGVATLRTSSLSEGDHQIRAAFGGSAGFLPSTSNPLNQRVDNRTVVTDRTYCNPGAITTPAGVGASTPYPSKIFVSNLAGKVTKVTASLRGITHAAATDLDIMLSAPTPARNLILLSDVGLASGATSSSVTNVDLVFDDAADSTVPSPIVSGTYQPTDEDPESQVDTFPEAAPDPSGETALATFEGADPNGGWSLWVVDDASVDVGAVTGGWCLTIEAKVETDTDLVAVPTSSIYGQSVTFTAAVTAGDDPVTDGQVEFRDGGTLLDTKELAGGTATFDTSSLSVGTHSITAKYLGTGTNGTSTDTLSYDVGKRPTVTTVASSLNPSNVGQSVTFTATVTDAAEGRTAVTSGTVQFWDGTIPLGDPVAVNPFGVATYPTANLAAGTHPITAAFLGTSQFVTSTSESVDQVVGRIPTRTGLTGSGSPSSVGDEVTFTATVTASGVPVPTGTIRFSDDGDDLCGDVAVTAGVATCSEAFTDADTHPITATYRANDMYGSSTSDPLPQLVTLIESTITVATTPNPSDPGEQVTVTATVASGRGQGDPTPTGTVDFTIPGAPTPVSASIDASGVATTTTSTLEPGTHSIEATYRGSAVYASSTDRALHGVRPIADAGGPYGVGEGAALRLQAGSGTTRGVTYGWDLNGDDDFTDATGATPTLTWDQLEVLGINDGPGTRTIRLVVRIEDIDSEPATAELTVTNTAPASVLTGGLTATVGQPFTIKVGADDPSSADTAALFTYTVDWGDGSPILTVGGPADPPVTHTYSVAGNFSATFTATDKDGGTGPGTRVMILAQLAPSPSPTPTTTDDYDYDDTGSGELASTGSVVGIASILVTVLLLGAGAGMVIAGRRRSGRHQG